MAEVTVSQLAKTVGTTVDRLLSQMKDAGLSHHSSEQMVSDEDKKILLEHLKSSHGSSTTAPKRITLKRKTIGTVKAAGSQGKRTVSVEVRKKRTYVKREEPAAPEEAGGEVAEIEAAELTDAAVATDAAVTAAPGEVTAPEDTTGDERDQVARRVDPFDAEELRQRAATKRKEQEAHEKARREAAVQAKRAEEERLKAEQLRQQADANKAGAAPGKQFRGRGDQPETPGEERPKKKSKGSRKQPKQRGKGRGHNIRVDDFVSNDQQAGFVSMGSTRILESSNRQEFSVPAEAQIHEVEIGESITVSELAQKMAIKANVVVKELMNLGIMATINQPIDQETAILVVEELGHKVKLVSENELEEQLMAALQDVEGSDASRPPVVTVMGHVDHGKTSLLDYIRQSGVAEGEAGGITQHIGAYHVETELGVISFLDTPGHAAFTAMRARGAQATDIVILVVAADDGVMPQTVEAIQHAKAAEVPIVVAVNKIDKEGADPERVKNELTKHEVIPEDWGGDTQFVHVSAHTGEGIDKLLESLSLLAEVLELTAPHDVPAKGVIIESRLDKGRGNIASVLVQEGTLSNGDAVLAGLHFGRVRNMSDERGQPIESAGPSIPVEILGLDGTPDAGDELVVVQDERKAREVADFRRQKQKENLFARQQKANLDSLFGSFESEETKRLNVVIKSDVRGSAEAIVAALEDIGNEEVEVNVVSSGVGAIAEADVNLAATTSSVIFGFNVRADATAKKTAESEAIEIRYYSVIYNLLDDVKDALSGMLAPELREEILGTAEVRDVFKSPKFGLVAGCMVVEGAVMRNKPIRVLRDDVVIHEGELDSLRRFKDDVSEVRSGTECGIGVKNYSDVRAGDKIEVFNMHEVARSL